MKLLDFGIARLMREVPSAPGQAETPTALATSAGLLIGTPGYMAPEQARGEKVDSRSDIFALGCVLYEMLTGAQAFVRRTPLDTLAAIINDHPPMNTPAGLPRAVARVVDRALQKDPADRFQSMQDFAFALTNTADATAVAAVPARQPRRTGPWVAAFAVVAAVFAGAILLQQPGSPGPFTLRASVVVPSSARPISPVVSPDGKWVGYIGLAGSRPDVYVQYLNGAAPVNLTQAYNLAVERRTIVGRLELSPDASFVVVPGATTTAGLWQLAGIWSVPAPLGGPPTRLPDRYAAIVVSSNGKRFAGIVADPIGGDALAVASSDGSDEHVLVPPVAGVHVHQPAWSPDDRYVYYVRTFAFPQGEIYRVAVSGGEPEIVIRTSGSAMYPAPTVDGRALIYAGNHVGEGSNLWWHSLDGTAERRLTVGAGDYTEPSLSRNGASLVCLARRRHAGLRRVAADATDGAIEPFGSESAGDTQPSAALTGERLFVASTRTGDRRIWSVDTKGDTAAPLSSGGTGDERPAVSPDGRLVAFLSTRGGQRGLWVVPAEGGTPRLLVRADIADAVSWAPDSRRIVYAVSGADGTPLWVVEEDTLRSYRIPGAIGRVPGWSPRGDVIAVIRATNNVPTLHVIAPDGRETRKPVPLAPVGSPMTLSWAPGGRQIAVATLPGRNSSEAWVVDLDSDTLRRVVTLPTPNEMDGVAWTSDGRWLIVGVVQYETEVLLIEGLPRK